MLLAQQFHLILNWCTVSNYGYLSFFFSISSLSLPLNFKFSLDFYSLLSFACYFILSIELGLVRKSPWNWCWSTMRSVGIVWFVLLVVHSDQLNYWDLMHFVALNHTVRYKCHRLKWHRATIHGPIVNNLWYAMMHIVAAQRQKETNAKTGIKFSFNFQLFYFVKALKKKMFTYAFICTNATGTWWWECWLADSNLTATNLTARWHTLSPGVQINLWHWMAWDSWITGNGKM